MTACRPRMTAAASGLTPETRRVITSTTVVTQAAKRGPRTSTWAVGLGLDIMLLLSALCTGYEGRTPVFVPGCSERGARKRGYSATTTTAATRDATQIHCAEIGEHA